MKRRVWLICLLCVVLSRVSLSLVACGDDEGEANKCAAGHTYGEWVVDTPATCTTDGVKSRTCSVCSNKETETIPAGHTYNGNGVCTACGYSPYTQGLAFELNADGASYAVTGLGIVTASEIFIPAIYQGLPVTVIWYEAFRGCERLTSVTIPDSITSIGYEAFAECESLQYNEYDNALYLGNVDNPYSALIMAKNEDITSCTIHANTKVIAGGAFYECSSLTNVSVPSGVTGIGESAFDGCSGLTNITIPDSVVIVGEDAFWDCDSLQYNEYDNAFYLGNTENPYVVLFAAKNTDITSCTIHSKTRIIYDEAFDSCGNLTDIEIPSSVTSIGEWAFGDCDSLTDIEIPDSVLNIGESAFACCDRLESITVENGNTKYHSAGNCLIETATKTLIAGCNNSVIPADGSVTRIAENAFRECGLTSIVIPNAVTSIGEYAFCNCSSLASIIIGSGLSEIEGFTFQGCSSLTSITIGSNVTSIGMRAFWDCSSLTSITIPNSVTSIHSDAFVDCSSLQYNEYDNALYLGNNENPYLWLMKAKNTAITSCTINSNTKFIFDDAFDNCISLTSIMIPDSVTSIGRGAFSNCRSLTSIMIPDSVTSIGGGAFDNCSSLQYNEYDNGLYIGNSENPYLVLVKAKNKDITSCTINSNTKFIHSSAFFNCRSLTSITIPQGVTSIGNNAFSWCGALTNITYGGTKAQWAAISKWHPLAYNTSEYTVTCTDGVLSKSESEE